MVGNNILLVEDEVIVARELQHRLEDMGYQVCGLAATAQEAMALCRQHAPELALMDISLRGEMDGIETARRLRQEMNTPTIFLTAHADPSTLERAKQAQPFGYLVKPVDPLELRATLEMALTRLRLEREREELIVQLQEALGRVKLLSGLLPICGFCKKIRNQQDQWEPLEEYIDKRSEASFSHGLCPDCFREHYPEYADEP